MNQLLPVLPRNSEVSEFHRNCLKPSHPGFSSGFIKNKILVCKERFARSLQGFSIYRSIYKIISLFIMLIGKSVPLVPGMVPVVLMPLQIATKLSETNSESIAEN